MITIYLTTLLAAIGIVSFANESPVENPAPVFRLKTLDGKTIDVQKLRGKVVVLNFWATWCGPCRSEIPGFLDVYRNYREKGVEIVGISLDQGSENEVKSFVQRYGIDYPVGIGDASVANLYGGIQAIPTTFFIDRNGTLRGKHVGFMNKQQLETTLKKLL